MNFSSKLLLGLVVAVSTQSAMADTNMGLGQGRLFLGSTKADPKELNTELTAQGIKNVDGNNHFGIEITFPTFQYLRLGLRYNYNLISQDETNSDPNTDYKASLTQSEFMGVARVPFYTSDIVHMDVFAGVGVTSSSYTIKTATQDGKLEQSAAPCGMAGASLALGYKQYYVVFEGGYESNKLSSLKSSGTINSNVTSMDLSGSYFLVGVMFDGIPIFKK